MSEDTKDSAADKGAPTDQTAASEPSSQDEQAAAGDQAAPAEQPSEPEQAAPAEQATPAEQPSAPEQAAPAEQAAAPPSMSRAWTWIILVAILAFTAGAIAGWLMLNGKPAQINLLASDICGQSDAAKQYRNQAWRVMNNELDDPMPPAQEIGMILRGMLSDQVPLQIRIAALEQYMRKGDRNPTVESSRAWALRFAYGDGPTRLRALRQLVDQDQAGAALAHCLLQDEARIRLVIAGQPVPLER